MFLATSLIFIEYHSAPVTHVVLGYVSIISKTITYAPGRYLSQKIFGTIDMSNWFYRNLWLNVQPFVAHTIGRMYKIKFWCRCNRSQSGLMVYLPTPSLVPCYILSSFHIVCPFDHEELCF